MDNSPSPSPDFGQRPSGASDASGFPAPRLAYESGSNGALTSVSQQHGSSLRRMKPKSEVMREAGGIGNVVNSFKRRWFLVLSLGMIAAAIGAYTIWRFAPSPTYTSMAIIAIRPATPSALDGPTPPVTQAEFVKGKEILLLSDPILSDAAESPGVSDLTCLEGVEDPIGWIKQRIRLQTSDETMSIAMEVPNSEDAPKLVNALVEAFIQACDNDERKRRDGRFDQLKDQLGRFKTELEGSRKEINEFYQQLQSSNITTIRERERSAIKSFEDDEAKLFEHQGRMQAMATDIKVLELRTRAPSKTATNAATQKSDRAKLEASIQEAVDDLVRRDPRLIEYDAQIKNAKYRYEQEQNRIKNGLDPVLSLLRSEYKKLQVARESYYANIKAEVAKNVRSRMTAVAPANANVNTMESQYQELKQKSLGLKVEETRLVEKVRKSREEWLTITKNILKLEEVQKKILTTEASEQKTREEFEEVRRERDNPTRVQVVHRAGRARMLDDPKRIWYLMAIAGLLASIPVMMTVVWFEARAKRIYSSESVAETMGFNIIGMVPKLPRFSDGGAPGNPKQELLATILRDSIDEIRTQVLHRCPAGRSYALLMTSAMPREGKSTLCVSLAESLARSGYNTLLIDCDLRRPILHLTLQVPIGPGLSEALTGRIDVNNAAMATAIPNLWILPAGVCRNEGLVALNHNRLRDVRAQASRRFDFIVIDTAPVMPVPDTLVVSQAVDFALFVVMRNSSRMPVVYDAYLKLVNFGVPVLGAIINGVQLQRGYGYGYGYGYASNSASTPNDVSSL